MLTADLGATASAITQPVRKRLHELDSLRGLMLVLMTVTHLPTRWRVYSHDFFGFVSAAEGFVFLSAFLTTLRLSPEQTALTVQKSLWQRAARLYGYHLALAALACAAALLFPNRPALHNLMGFFIDQPRGAVVGLLTLAYCPPLLDILPMYVLFLAATPFALRLAERYGYPALIAASALLWLSAQLGARPLLQNLVIMLIGDLPRECFGAFNLLAWQFLWVLGLCLGRSPHAVAIASPRLPRAVVITALVASLAFFGLRVLSLAGLELSPERLFNKWHLGPARLLNLTCLILVFVHIVRRLIPARSTRVLSLLGRASLPVFCAHIVLCLCAFLLVDDADRGLEPHEEVPVLAFTFTALIALAWQRQAARSSSLQHRQPSYATRDPEALAPPQAS